MALLFDCAEIWNEPKSSSESGRHRFDAAAAEQVAFGKDLRTFRPGETAKTLDCLAVDNP